MSHLTTNSKANIVSKEAFMAACKELGYTKITENTTIKAYDGKTMKVDVAVKNSKGEIGLVKNATGKYDLVGDFQCFGWELSGAIREAMQTKETYVSDEEIQNCILRYTTKHTLVSKYNKLGYNCKTTTDKTGALQVVMTKLF